MIPALIAIGIFAALIIIPIILWGRGIIALSGDLIAFWVLSAAFSFMCFIVAFFGEGEGSIMVAIFAPFLIFIFLALIVLGIRAFRIRKSR